jgi:hypothetical protein
MLVLTSIEGVRAEIAGLRADLAGSSPEAPGKARQNPWASLSGNQTAERIANMKESKVAKKAAGVSVPLPTAAASSSPASFKSVLLRGVRYLVDMDSGHAYYRNEDGSQGEWAGIFSRTPMPHINTSVPKPNGLAGGKRKSTRKHTRKQKKTRNH